MSAADRRGARHPRRLAVAGLVAALVVFAGLGGWQARTFMVWSEETMVHSAPAAQLLAPEPDAAGSPRIEPSCLERAGGVRVVRSSSRPTLNLCSGGRVWPILIAPYFSGYFYWPFGVLAPLHHDDAFALRALGMVLGAISILLTYRAVARLAGAGAAAVTALATSLLPCFVLIHATLLHFETLPWVATMGAILCLLGCPGLVPSSDPIVPGDAGKVPTRRVVLAGLFTGVALAANLKSVVILAVLGALALRLGVPVRRIRGDQWARATVALVAPLAPMILLLFTRADGYGDKSTGWYRTLAAHLTEPRWFLSSGRGLFLMWADIGAYLGRYLAEAPRLHVGALAVAVASAAFVVVDAVRTWVRRKGCPVTAACGFSILAFTLMVTLLYDHFPSNFTSLHTVYAASVGVTSVRVARAIADATKVSWALAPVAALALLPLASSTVDSIRAGADIELHTNANAERAVAAYLAERVDDGAQVVTADSMIAGVIDSLTHGAVRTLRAHDFFSKCQPQRAKPAPPTCVQERWRSLLPLVARPSAHFVAPLDWARWGSDHVSYVPALEEVARELGYRVVRERTFATPRGVPVLGLFRIDAPVAAP